MRNKDKKIIQDIDPELYVNALVNKNTKLLI